jgi:hypothetical protein
MAECLLGSGVRFRIGSEILSLRLSFWTATNRDKLSDLILWVLYTGMQWKCVPVPRDADGKPTIHYTNVYRVFAKWADDGSLWQAFLASVRHLAAENHLDTRVLHGDGTTTGAKKGAMALATRATSTRKGRRSSP